MGDSYESFYVGGPSSLSPEYGNFVGYRMSASNIGSPTGIQTANQIGEVLARIREGVRVVELQPLQGEVFDQIPKEHFKEIAAISKLTGVKPSLHAPIIDAVGFVGEQGSRWGGETAREDAERKLFSVIEKGHDLDPNGNVPIVIHSSAGIPGNEYRPGKGTKPGDKDRFYEKMIALYDQDSKQITTVSEEEKFYPHGMKEGEWEKGKIITARDYLESVNHSQWEQKMTNLAFYQKEADEIYANLMKGVAEHLLDKDGEKMTPQEAAQIGDLNNSLTRADLFLQNNQLTFNNLYSNAYKYGDDELKKKLREIHDSYDSELRKMQKEFSSKGGANPFEVLSKKVKLFNNYSSAFTQITMEHPPEMLKTMDDFAREQTAKTIGGVAFKSYDKFKDSSPVLALENMYQGMAFAKAEEMENLIKASRKSFAEKLIEEKGMGKGEAEDIAKKFIGATWDVGHVNIMKKAGFTDEDIAKETEKMAKYVKHIHLTDNFGYSDSHLAPGMGNVPFKKIFEKLEKAGVLDNARKIVEAGVFATQFKKSPHPYTLSAFGSPIYGAKMAPYWNQAMESNGGYFGSPLAYLPERHFSIYGSGFSGLPEELGGQIPTTQSRFAGTANA